MLSISILLAYDNFTMILGPFHKHRLTLTPTWKCYHTPSKVRNEITYPFRNFNGAAVEVWNG